ncbi:MULTISPECIES: sigma-70 family RNA polymerase sigma factor [Paenibacillus]|uniref:sigma-70 family RNA polymerase sigma factor n=1 Tax=Paenibacillus TaxID=44249 RepID=UPI0030DBB1F4
MTDQNIRDAIVRRDANVMESLMNEYAGLLWNVVRSILRLAPEEEVEECVADTFFAFWQNPHAYDPERSSLKNYLAMVAKRKAIDRYRKLMRAKEAKYEEQIHFQSSPDVLTQVIRQENREELEQMIDLFPEPDREIMKRRLYDDQKPGEISESMSLQLRQVHNKLYRSKQRLRTWWENRK